MMLKLRVVTVLVFATIGAATASADVRTTTIRYTSGANGTGYDSVSFDAEYALHACGGELVITTKFVRGSFRWSSTYWLDGTSYPTPAGLTHVVNDQGSFNGTVRVRGGDTVGSFRTMAGMQSGHGCLGDTARIASLSRYVDVKDKEAVNRFIDSLQVIPDTNAVYKNYNVESAIRHKLAEEEREAKRKVEEERKRKEAEERKRKEEEERKRKQDEEAKRSEDEDAKRSEDAARDAEAASLREQEARKREAETREKAKRDTAEREATEREARRKAHDDAAAARTQWTEADERDTSGDYWPDSRCAWYDSNGNLRGPVGRHRCNPAFLEKVRQAQLRQLEIERAQLEAEYREERRRDAIATMGGGTAEGTAVATAALAAAPLVDALGEAANNLNNKWPLTFDLEASGRLATDGGTGYGFSFRAPGVVYAFGGYASYDSAMYEHVSVYSFGMGMQVPMTRAFTLRAVELGMNLGGKKHLLAPGDVAASFIMRSGALYRLAGGLSVSLMIGFDTMSGIKGTSELGLVWRFDMRSSQRYVLQ